MIIFHLFRITFDANFFYIINFNLFFCDHGQIIGQMLTIVFLIHANFFYVINSNLLFRDHGQVNWLKAWNNFLLYLIIFDLIWITFHANFFYIINSNLLFFDLGQRIGRKLTIIFGYLK